ncbi:hypothetical protein GOEFS_083_00060 [Gordonia effusa NBRC 100432]|uniref:Uncharacterized protein n=1 Tax=Gordonia effusa NBRC 100432 TaxID=1077974 RepID=H0R2S5_9ACTN|nr:hypothetical protein [Gordonia effusa]GAB19376.1 hypothetical protein GOEFS_083_00060 [Gordonia effusa NBRC 100432]
MAPSGEHRIEDLGAATVQAAAVAASNAAAALRSEVGRLHAEGKGLTVAKSCETLTARAGAAEKLFATLAATAKALKIREDAAKAWNRNAPKDSEIKAAEEAVTAAKQKLKDASAASGDTSAASKELEAAQKHLGDLRRRRREADAAYDKAQEKADLALSKVRAVEVIGDAPGTGTPSTGTGNGSGSPSTSTGTGKPSGGTPAKTTAGGTPKPSKTPAAGTPSPSTAPSTTATSTATPESTAALAALLASQQQQQPQSAQQAQPTAAATPAAAAPVASTPTQQGKDKDLAQSKTSPWDKILGSDGVLDTGELTGLIGSPLTLGGGASTSTHATPAATVTPSAPATPTPSPTGLSAGTVTQPVTSGNSATGLNTATDVSGRTAEQQRGPFSVGPETKTSGATGTGTSATSPAHSTGARPMGGGMPMMPMGAMGGPGGGGKDREQAQTTSAAGSAESDLLHGRHTVSEAVPGGTIAQKDHPRRRGEDAA